MKLCPFCAESIQNEAIRCKYCKSDLSSTAVLASEGASRTGKKIQETKCTCQACGHKWFYGKKDEIENVSNAMGNMGKGMMCCGGCFPALLIPDKKVVDLNKCPKCNSRAVIKEQVSYEV